jgi:hypothetical protein
MATSLLTRSVLPATPAANCDSYIDGLLDEMRARIDAIAFVPGSNVIIDAGKVQELRGNFSELAVAIRNQLKWARVA